MKKEYKIILIIVVCLVLVPIICSCCIISTIVVFGENSGGVDDIEKNKDKDTQVADKGEVKGEATEETKEEVFTVTRIIDGDTIIVEGNDDEELTVRLVGIDTPEISGGRECYAEESKKGIEKMILGKKVTMQIDENQGDKDRYDRYLRFIFLEDGTHINEKMLREGYAYIYETPKKHIYHEDFINAETKAKEESLGLWNSTACNGQREMPTPSPTPTSTPIPIPTATPTPTPVQEVVIPQNNNPGYVCNCEKTCAQLSCDEAYFQFETCNCYERDGNNDGIPCNAQCR